jgi:hypothetical protein
MKNQNENTEFGKQPTEVKPNVAVKCLNSSLRSVLQVKNLITLDGVEDVRVVKQADAIEVILKVEKGIERKFHKEQAHYLKNGSKLLEMTEGYPDDISLEALVVPVSVTELSSEMVELQLPISCITIEDLKAVMEIATTRKRCLLLRKYHLFLPDGISLLNQAEADFDNACAGKVGRRTKETIKRKQAESLQKPLN